jgi:hypothetical protein
MGRTLRIEVVVLATPSTVLLVGCGHLKDNYTSGLHISQKAGTITPCTFNSNALQFSERSHPSEHQFIALPRGGKALRAKHPIALVNNSSDMQIFVSIHTTDDG